jgi:hypothetical protein
MSMLANVSHVAADALAPLRPPAKVRVSEAVVKHLRVSLPSGGTAAIRCRKPRTWSNPWIASRRACSKRLCSLVRRCQGLSLVLFQIGNVTSRSRQLF